MNLFEFLYLIINCNYFILTIAIIIIFAGIFYYFHGKNKLKYLKELNDPIFSIQDLKNTPLVNFLVPAWKEDEILKDCLNSLKNLNYPTLKIIVNAGGNEITEKIANEFKKYNNFIILQQKPRTGKINAINEALEYVSEGLVYMIDSDVILNQEIFLRVIGPIVNLGENVVSGPLFVKPLISQQKKYLVKFLEIRYIEIYTFQRYSNRNISGPNCCVKYDVIKNIGNFSQNQYIAEDTSRGMQIIRAGYKIFQLYHPNACIFHKFPVTLKEASDQRIRWIENSFYYNLKYHKVNILKFFGMIFASIVTLITPALIFINLNLFIISLLVYSIPYVSFLRKLNIYKFSRNQEELEMLNIVFFILIIILIYLEAFVNIIIFFKIIFLGKKRIFNKRKNLGKNF